VLCSAIVRIKKRFPYDHRKPSWINEVKRPSVLVLTRQLVVLSDKTSRLGAWPPTSCNAIATADEGIE